MEFRSFICKMKNIKVFSSSDFFDSKLVSEYVQIAQLDKRRNFRIEDPEFSKRDEER